MSARVFVQPKSALQNRFATAPKMSLTSAERAARGLATGESVALIRAFCALLRPPQRPKRRLRRKIFREVETAWRLPSIARSMTDWHDTSSC